MKTPSTTTSAIRDVRTDHRKVLAAFFLEDLPLPAAARGTNQAGCIDPEA